MGSIKMDETTDPNETGYETSDFIPGTRVLAVERRDADPEPPPPENSPPVSGPAEAGPAENSRSGKPKSTRP
jgi:hypothetical protein